MKTRTPTPAVALACLLVLTACGEPPRESPVDDSLVGRLMRQVGPGEMAVLLADPGHPQHPGLPVYDLLYLIDHVPEATLVQVVQRAGARRTAMLVNAIKRLGCNAPTPAYPDGRFDIPFAEPPSACTRAHYDHLQVLVSLLAGVSDGSRLSGIVGYRRSEIDAKTTEGAAWERSYLEKLAFVVVYLRTTQSLVDLLDVLLQGDDVGLLLDHLDGVVAVPVRTRDVIDGVALRGVRQLVGIKNGVADARKVGALVNGARLFGGGDDAQRSYLADKLLPVVTGGSETGDPWVLKQVTLLDELGDPTPLVAFLAALDASAVPGVLDFLARCRSPGEPAPRQTSITTVAYLLEHAASTAKKCRLVATVPPARLAALVDGVSEGSQVDDAGAPDPRSAGRKLVATVDAVEDVDDLGFLLGAVSDVGRVATLLDHMTVAGSARLGVQLNLMVGGSSWDPVTPGSARGVGKLVNVIEHSRSLADVAALVLGINDPAKLAATLDDVDDSSLLVALINAVSRSAHTRPADLAGLVNTLALSDVPRVATLLTALAGTRDDLLADLLAPFSGVSLGLGFADMAVLLGALRDDAAAGRLAAFIAGLEPSVAHAGAAISTREALVRLVRAGVTYETEPFPGIGGEHVAVLMNSAADASRLATLVNTMTLETMAPLIGCADRVGDPSGRGQPPFDPDFWTPCTALHMGW